MYPLDKIFRPRSVAAIGGSDRKGTVGHALMVNLLTGGFQGKVYPVNPGHSTVNGEEMPHPSQETTSFRSAWEEYELRINLVMGHLRHWWKFS
jgi:acyl-CoA synthetase (NDP forming)